MTDARRSSRADRRKTADTPQPTGENRRQPPPLQVTVHSQVRLDELQLFVRDPITAENCLSAKEQILSHAQRSDSPAVVVDLEKATYIDTTGLAVLFDVKKQISAQGRSFFIQNPSRSVLRMLNITRMNRVFSVRFTTGDNERIPGPAAEAKPE
jgi:anti-sigma B factor antagonist